MKSSWIVISFLVVASFVAACGDDREPFEVEDWFSERLPSPASRHDVESLLIAQAYPYDVIDARYESVLREEGIPPDSVIVRALVPGRSGWLVDQDFNVFFVMAEDDTVTEIVVAEVFTGP